MSIFPQGYGPAQSQAEFDFLHHTKSGNFYSAGLIKRTQQVSVLRNLLYAVPYITPRQINADRIALHAQSSAVVGTFRLGIYNDNGSMYPSSLITDAGTVTNSSSGVKALVINVTLPRGIYWLVAVGDTTPASQGWTANGDASSNSQEYSSLGFAPTNFINPGVYINRSFTFAPLPSTYPTGASPISGLALMMALRIA